MIIVVEGPSAAGKTTWCQRHYPDSTVFEASTPAAAPDRTIDPHGAAEYWAAANRDRWQTAVSVEKCTGLAVCDTDPFKLHYIWSLWQTGNASKSSWQHELRLHREMFEREKIGIADLFLVSVPDYQTLLSQKSGDPTRARSSFELHASLAPTIRRWYEAVDELEPGRVIWYLPDSGLSPDHMANGPRSVRSGAQLFDQLLERLESEDQPA